MVNAYYHEFTFREWEQIVESNRLVEEQLRDLENPEETEKTIKERGIAMESEQSPVLLESVLSVADKKKYDAFSRVFLYPIKKQLFDIVEARGWFFTRAFGNAKFKFKRLVGYDRPYVKAAWNIMAKILGTIAIIGYVISIYDGKIMKGFTQKVEEISARVNAAATKLAEKIFELLYEQLSRFFDFSADIANFTSYAFERAFSMSKVPEKYGVKIANLWREVASTLLGIKTEFSNYRTNDIENLKNQIISNVGSKIKSITRIDSVKETFGYASLVGQHEIVRYYDYEGRPDLDNDSSASKAFYERLNKESDVWRYNAQAFSKGWIHGAGVTQNPFSKFFSFNYKEIYGDGFRTVGYGQSFKGEYRAVGIDSEPLDISDGEKRRLVERRRQNAVDFYNNLRMGGKTSTGFSELFERTIDYSLVLKIHQKVREMNTADYLFKKLLPLNMVVSSLFKFLRDVVLLINWGFLNQDDYELYTQFKDIIRGEMRMKDNNFVVASVHSVVKKSFDDDVIVETSNTRARAQAVILNIESNLIEALREQFITIKEVNDSFVETKILRDAPAAEMVVAPVVVPNRNSSIQREVMRYGRRATA